MNPTIEALILQIVTLALRITSQGQWHVFAHISGHVRHIDIYIHPADHDYQAVPRTPHALSLSVEYAHTPKWDQPDGESELSTRLFQLHSMHAQLLTYLQPSEQQVAA